MENSDKPLQSSDGHNPGSRDELHQQAEKPQADAPAVAGFDRDQQELETGLDDGDLDNDVE
jgi:hypothetical protein